MKILIFLILIVPCEERLCISRSNYLNFSTLSLNEKEVEDTLTSLQLIDIETKQCRIEVTSSYTEHRLEVRFNPIISEEFPPVLEKPTLITKLTLDSDPTSIVNVLIYDCALKDGCERDFLIKRLPFLLELDYTELKLKLTRIFFEDDAELNEHIKKLLKSEWYFNRHCALIIKIGLTYASERDDTCDDDRKKSTTITITNKILVNTYNELTYKISYECLFYGCNDYDNMKKIFNITRSFYDVSGIMYESNRTRKLTSTTKFIDDTVTIQTETSKIITVSNQLSTIRLKNSVAKHFQIISTFGNVYFLLFISFLLIHK